MILAVPLVSHTLAASCLRPLNSPPPPPATIISTTKTGSGEKASEVCEYVDVREARRLQEELDLEAVQFEARRFQEESDIQKAKNSAIAKEMQGEENSLLRSHFGSSHFGSRSPVIGGRRRRLSVATDQVCSEIGCRRDV